MEEEVFRGQIESREVEDRGSQSAHGGRGLQTVPDHVAHHQGHPGPGQGDGVEPVTPDT
jgi:hypothetical protein